MNVLLVGAAGHVGSILRPALEAEHDCRYLDLRPVPGAEERTFIGSLCDPDALAKAMAGQDVCVQLAMAHYRREPDVDNIGPSYDVHVKGMHYVLQAAADAGCQRVIYASTLSVYQRSRPPDDGTRSETDPPDAVNLYGLTKRLGEDVCQAFSICHPELSILALRMVLPRTEEQWSQPPQPRENRSYMTGPDDLRRAYLSAIALNGHQGFDAISICSDIEQQILNLGKAKEVLGWVPEGR